LAKSLERHDALAPILWGLTANVLNQGRVAESLPWVEQMLEIAKATGDPDLLLAGHALASNGYTFAGEFTKSVQHFDRALGSTTTKNITIWRIASTLIPKLWPVSSARLGPGYWVTLTEHRG
jgi:hypothetical protein